MEMQKAKYEVPELDELQVNSFTVIAGASPKTEDVPGGDEGGKGVESPLKI